MSNRFDEENIERRHLDGTTRGSSFVLGSLRGVGAKARPGCRDTIIYAGLRPFVGEDGFWNGFQAALPNGKKTFLSDGLKKQMGLMLREGFWPDLLDPQLNEQAREAKRKYRRLDRLSRRELGL